MPKRSGANYTFQEWNQDITDITPSCGLEMANSRAVVGSFGSSVGSAGSGSESHGSVRPPRAYHKLGASMHSNQNQRLFASAPGDVARRNRQNLSSISAESPPSDSVGFFFGSTPPDNYRSAKNDLKIYPASLPLTRVHNLDVLYSERFSD